MHTRETAREIPQVTEQLRRFGENLVEQARLLAKYAAVVAVSTTLAGPADAKPKANALLPSPRHSLHLVTDPEKNPLGVEITPDTNLAEFIDPTVLCGSCRIELRCPGGNIQAPVEVPIMRMENGGASVDPDAMRGAVGLAFCPGYKAPRPFAVPEYLPLTGPSSDSSRGPEPELVPLVGPEAPATAAATEAPPPVVPEVEAAAAVSAPVPAPLPPKRFSLAPQAVQFGGSVPVTSTDEFFADPGFFARSLWQREHVGGALSARWNPTRQTPASDGRFVPVSPGTSLRGNAFGVGAEGFGRANAGEIPNVAQVELRGGVSAEALAVHAGRHNNVARDSNGDFADVPPYMQVMPVASGFAELRFDFDQRVSFVVGGRAGVSVIPVQIRPGASHKSRLGFMEVNAGAQISLP